MTKLHCEHFNTSVVRAHRAFVSLNAKHGPFSAFARRCPTLSACDTLFGAPLSAPSKAQHSY